MFSFSAHCSLVLCTQVPLIRYDYTAAHWYAAFSLNLHVPVLFVNFGSVVAVTYCRFSSAPTTAFAIWSFAICLMLCLTFLGSDEVISSVWFIFEWFRSWSCVIIGPLNYNSKLKPYFSQFGTVQTRCLFRQFSGSGKRRESWEKFLYSRNSSTAHLVLCCCCEILYFLYY